MAATGVFEADDASDLSDYKLDEMFENVGLVGVIESDVVIEFGDAEESGEKGRFDPYDNQPLAEYVRWRPTFGVTGIKLVTLWELTSHV